MSEISKKSPLVWLTALALLVALMAVTAPAPAQAANLNVTNGPDSGPGSFRQAITDANADSSINVIKFDKGVTVNLSTTVTYTGSQDLTIGGKGSTVSGASVAKSPTWDEALFLAISDADLTLKDLSFVDSFGTGAAVFVPEDATGTVDLTLDKVTIDSATYHGLLIDGQAYNGFNTDDILHPDCVDPWYYDSAAGIKLTMKKSNIINNGQLPAGYAPERQLFRFLVIPRLKA